MNTKLISLISFLIFFLSSNLYAHHNLKSYTKICKDKKVVETFGFHTGIDSGDTFIINHRELPKKTFQIEIHGDIYVGGYIRLVNWDKGDYNWKNIIIPEKSMKKMPYSELGKSPTDILMTYAIGSKYEKSIILNYERAVLRYSILGNSPTNEITNVITGWADCK